jgi:hypothetical protein
MGAFAISAVAIAALVVHVFDSTPVSVGSPKIVVASVQPNGVSTAGNVASAQPNAGSTPGNAASAQPNAGSTPGNAASVQPNAGSTPGNAASVQPNGGSTPGNAASVQPNASSAAPPVATVAATAPPTLSIPPQSGALIAGKEARQHRIFVDGKPVGEGPGTYFVACGAHTVKIGSSGKPRDVDLACGTSINIP